MRLFAVLLILASLPLSMAQPSLNSADIEIALEGANEVMMPSASLAMPGGDWTYPYENYPVYAPGQNISGSFRDPGREAGQKLGICLIRLNTTSFLETLKILYKPSMPNMIDLIGMEALALNDTGAGRFSFPGLEPGLYAIAAADLIQGEVLSALPIFVADGQVSVDAPDTITLGGMGQVQIQSSDELGNISRRYGAVLVSAKDYDTASLKIKDTSMNESSRDMVSTIALGSRSMEITGEPKISQKLVEDILAILPQDSAIALQESNTSSSSMYLITDSGWAPGKYILTCGVYTSRGITGIGQRYVELVP